MDRYVELRDNITIGIISTKSPPQQKIKINYILWYPRTIHSATLTCLECCKHAINVPLASSLARRLFPPSSLCPIPPTPCLLPHTKNTHCHLVWQQHHLAILPELSSCTSQPWPSIGTPYSLHAINVLYNMFMTPRAGIEQQCQWKQRSILSFKLASCGYIFGKKAMWLKTVLRLFFI